MVFGVPLFWHKRNWRLVCCILYRELLLATLDAFRCSSIVMNHPKSMRTTYNTAFFSTWPLSLLSTLRGSAWYHYFFDQMTESQGCLPHLGWTAILPQWTTMAVHSLLVNHAGPNPKSNSQDLSNGTRLAHRRKHHVLSLVRAKTWAAMGSRAEISFPTWATLLDSVPCWSLL